MAGNTTTVKLTTIMDSKGGDKVASKFEKISATTERANRGVSEMSSNQTKNFSKMSQGLSGLVHVYASLAANIFALSAAFRAMSDAADFKRMIAASHQLSIQTGQDFASVAKGLKAISANAIDMQTAMQTANLGLSAGFSGRQMEEITKLATQAAIALGRSVPDAISRLTTAIVKGEPELTDELGIILRLKEATDDYAKTIGKTAKELTTSERLQAVRVQALERGLPKYGGIKIEAQPFDALLSNIKEVTKEFLMMGNSVVEYFIKPLSESKFLLGAIFLLLGKILLTKTTHLFGEGLTGRLAQTEEKLVSIRKKLDDINKAQRAQQVYKSNVAFRNESLANFISNTSGLESLPDKMRGIVGNQKKWKKTGMHAGKTFSAALFNTLDKESQKKIKKITSKMVKDMGTERSVTLRDTSGNIGSIDIEEAHILKKMEAADRRIEKANKMAGTAITRLGNRYTQVAETVKMGFFSAFAAGISGTETLRAKVEQVNVSLAKSNMLVRGIGKAAVIAGFAMGKVAKGMDMVASVFGKIMFWLSMIGLVFGALNKVFGFISGNLSKANDKLKDVDERMKTIQETKREMIINPKSVDEVNENLKITVNLSQQYKENVEDVTDAIGLLAKSTYLEKFWERMVGGDNTTEKLGEKLAKAFNVGLQEGLLTSLNPDKILAEISKDLKTTNIEVPIVLPNIQKTLQDYKDKAIKAQKEIEDARFPNAGTMLELNKNVTFYNNVVASITEELAKHKNEVEGSLRVSFNLGEVESTRLDILKDMQHNQGKATAGLVEHLQVMGDDLVAAKLMNAVLNAFGFSIDKSVDSARELSGILVDAARTLSNILSEFSDFSGKKIIQQLSQVEKVGKALQLSKQLLIKDQKGLTEVQDKAYTQAIEDNAKLFKSLTNVQVNRISAENASHARTIKTIVSGFEKKTTVNQAVRDATIRSLKSNYAKIDAQVLELKSGQAKEYLSGESKAEILGRAARIAILETRMNGIADDIADVAGTADRKKAKKSGGGHKAEKFRGNDAQVALEGLRKYQVVFEQVSKSQHKSGAERVAAAKALYLMEDKMFTLRLAIIKADKDDAARNRDLGKDENARSKGRLDFAKAETAEYLLRASIEEQMIARRIEMLQIQDQYASYGSLGEVGANVMFSFGQRIKELRSSLDGFATTFTNALKDVFTTATHSIAEAFVSGENNIAESIAESMKSSAINMIDQGLQTLFLNMIPDALMKSFDPQVIATGFNTTALIANTAALTGNAIGDIASSGEGEGGWIMTLFNWIMSFFAKGGIMKHVNGYANGTIVSKPELAMIGEGKNNEAVVPLPDNRSIPVTLNKGAGAPITNNSSIVVNITSDGTTESSAESNGEQGKQIGMLMELAIRKQLLTEQRPGGLLYRR